MRWSRQLFGRTSLRFGSAGLFFSVRASTACNNVAISAFIFCTTWFRVGFRKYSMWPGLHSSPFCVLPRIWKLQTGFSQKILFVGKIRDGLRPSNPSHRATRDLDRHCSGGDTSRRELDLRLDLRRSNSRDC